ncbi:hypothetical protein GOP47_0002866 [Adiantum capillus-veneris]|uniref:Cytochrome P450 n=1 Tax=Adiantum capillus-veneris TaxID=13818 RepID=A0A9D4ZPJ4_ADICA|nr:hypothetical protein GOP47_0002866 [Adiantum capillus-veneris]
MNFLSSVIASLYVQTKSCRHDVAGTALGCVLAFFIVKPMVVHVFTWMKIHLAPALLRGGELPPGSLGFLLISETLHFISALRQGGPRRFLKERTAKHGSQTFKTSLFLNSTVIVQGAAGNRFLANAENKRDLLNSWPAFTLDLLGKNAPAAVHGSQHKRQRQVLSACLGPGALQKVMCKADRMIGRHIEASWADGAHLSIDDTVKMHVLRFACSLLIGAEDEALVRPIETQFRIWTAGVISMPLDVPGTRFYKSKRARDVLRRQMEEVIQQRRRQLHAEQPPINGKYNDLLSQMILARHEDGTTLTPEELRDVTLFLLFAGHETSATTLIFALKFLEQNPPCFDRLVQEHKAIASRKQHGETLNWVDLTNMKYTWALLQETMRLRPPTLGGMKEAQKDLIHDGYIIPKGWKIYYCPSSTQENDAYFKEARNFDPSRFEAHRLQKEGLPPFSFVPFGIGPHSCKGGDFARMTMSLYVHHLIMGKIKWTSLELYEQYHCFPVLQFTKGYQAIVTRDNLPSECMKRLD